MSTKKINFNNWLKYAEHKKFSICIQVYKIFAGDVFDKMYEVLYTRKIKSKNKQFFNRKS